MKRLAKRGHLFLLAVFALGACGHMKAFPIVPSERITQPRSDDTFVVVGLGVGGKLESTLLALFVNGELQQPKGVTKRTGVQGLPALSYPKAGIPWTLDSRPDYLRVAPGARRYRVWRIPKHNLKYGRRAFVYIHTIRNKRGVFGKAKPRVFSRSIPLPIGTSQRGFRSAAFELLRPGVYYLGDLDVSGRIVYRSDLSYEERQRHPVFKHDTATVWTIAIARVALRVSRSPTALAKHLQQSGLDRLALHDVSNRWQDRKYDRLEEYLGISAPKEESREAKRSGAHRHDGFFLGMGGASGLHSTSATVSEAPLPSGTVRDPSTTFAGFGAWLHLGYCVVDNLALHATFDITAPLGGDANVTQFSSSIGGGVTYYLPWHNMYLTGNLTYGSLDYRAKKGTNTNDGNTSASGVGLKIGVGKEWWVSSNWGLGGVLMARYMNVTKSDVVSAHVLDILAGLSATYN